MEMEEPETSKRNISDKWINNNVYEALEKIEEHERLMKNGCSDLIEYIQEIKLGLNRLPQIQIQNMKFMINEFDILIKNTKKILKKEDYEDAKKRNEFHDNSFKNGLNLNGDKQMVYNIIHNNPKRTTYFKLNQEPFNFLANKLSDLRMDMITYLSPVLFITTGDLDKPTKEI